MTDRHNFNRAPFVKIVYSKIHVNGRLQLIPFELYADGSLRRCR